MKPDKPDEKLIESPVTAAVGPEVGLEGRGSTSKELTTEQVSLIEKYTKDLNQYLQEQAIVFQQISSTIPDSLYLKIKGKPTVKEAWDALKANFERRSRMITIELRKRLQDTRCAENGNLRTHFDTIQTMREELESLGTILSEQDFSAIILGSLLKSYDQFLSAVTTTASVLKQDLDPEDLMQTIIDEYDRQSTRQGNSKEKAVRLRSLLEITTLGKLGKGRTRTLNALTATKRDIRRPTVGQKEGERRDKGPN